MDARLDGLIRDMKLGGASLQGVNYDETARIWWTAVGIVDPDGRRTAFLLEFQHVVPVAEGPAYLVVCWVVIPPDEMRPQATSNLALLRGLDDLNGEAGAKFRLQSEADGATSLLCEVDLPIDLLSPDLLVQAVERSRDLVAAFFDEIQHLARP